MHHLFKLFSNFFFKHRYNMLNMHIGDILSSVNKNNYRKYTQIYTFLGYFRLPFGYFINHKMTIKYLSVRVLFMLNKKILMLITSNNTGKRTFGLKQHTNVANFAHIKDI